MIEICPPEDILGPGLIIYKRRGGPETRDLNAAIAERMRKIVDRLGLYSEHLAGARNPKVVDIAETHLKGRDTDTPLVDGSFLDTTFRSKKTGRSLHTNTVDTKTRGDTGTP